MDNNQRIADTVRALRICATGYCKDCDFEAVPTERPTTVCSQLKRSAADLIESLQAQLERETKSANRWICSANDYRKEAERLKDINKALESDIYNAEMNLEHITAQLTESQRRADAAVEDMKRIVDAVREEHCDETCCFACAYDCDTSITDSGCYANECPGFDRDDCFEWRGAHDEEVRHEND